MYSMSCAPLTCCSMDAATDSETTLALAPGNAAFTVTWGGTTCGYCALAALGLPIAQYPQVVPPQVTVDAAFPGANANVGRDHLRVLRDRQAERRQRAGQDHQQRDDRREHRPLDEEVEHRGLLRRLAYRGQGDGPHGRAGADLAGAFDYHAVARGEAARDHPFVVQSMAGHDLAR